MIHSFINDSLCYSLDLYREIQGVIMRYANNGYMFRLLLVKGVLLCLSIRNGHRAKSDGFLNNLTMYFGMFNFLCVLLLDFVFASWLMLTQLATVLS